MHCPLTIFCCYFPPILYNCTVLHFSFHTWHCQQGHKKDQLSGSISGLPQFPQELHSALLCRLLSLEALIFSCWFSLLHLWTVSRYVLRGGWWISAGSSFSVALLAFVSPPMLQDSAVSLCNRCALRLRCICSWRSAEPDNPPLPKAEMLQQGCGRCQCQPRVKWQWGLISLRFSSSTSIDSFLVCQCILLCVIP